jgi:hypothetical protein
MKTQEYFDCARKNEAIFRSILKDVKSRTPICPTDLDFNAPLEEIFQRYSQGSRYGKFTILNFKKGPSKQLENLAENEALISIEDIACLSGIGFTLKYKIKTDNSVEYVNCIGNWMS